MKSTLLLLAVLAIMTMFYGIECAPAATGDEKGQMFCYCAKDVKTCHKGLHEIKCPSGHHITIQEVKCRNCNEELSECTDHESEVKSVCNGNTSCTPPDFCDDNGKMYDAVRIKWKCRT